VSRIFVSSPGQNIHDAASVKLYNADMEGDISFSAFMTEKLSSTCSSTCVAEPLLKWYKQIQHSGDLELLFSIVTSASLLHYLPRSYFDSFLSNDFLPSVCSLHQQRSIAIPVVTFFRLCFHKVDKIMKNRSWIQQSTFKNTRS